MNNDHLQRKTRVTDVGQIYVCVCKTSDIFMFIYNRNKREKKNLFSLFILHCLMFQFYCRSVE
jgi:hypothetical protein